MSERIPTAEDIRQALRMDGWTRDEANEGIERIKQRGIGIGHEMARETMQASIGDAEWIVHTRTALSAATKAIRAVLDLHQPEPFTDGRDYCTECYEDHGHDGAIPVLFPCPTVAAITEALGEA